VAEDLGDLYRRAWPQLLGSLVRRFGRVELAEDCLQEACTRALAVSDLRDPAAWIATTARRLMMDEFRREEVRQRKAPQLVRGDDAGEMAVPSTTGDDRLDLIALACHPALPATSRMPLALRFVLGTPTDAIADAFLVPHATMSARLTRAKRRLDEDGRWFDVATGPQVGDVLEVISVLYTLGHTAVSGDALGRDADRRTGLDLARAAVAAWPSDPEARGLLALLLLTDARRATRPATLREADRSRWDRLMIEEGLALATEVLPTMGRFALQAGIAGLHSSAPSWESTDLAAIVRLYDRLVERWPSPGAQIARAVAIGYGAAGPGAGLDALEVLAPGDGATTRQYAAARADLLRQAGRPLEARAAYLEARALERNTVLHAFLDTRLAELASIDG
jgi:RNA polymerase sigma-70 factor (ECF subfamily)